MRYDESIIQQVREANDIVDVIGQHVRLTKKGGSYFGLCPFHGEKTPSFSVNPRLQVYHCFGCGVGGNVINFEMAYENYSFTEALTALAQRANIELPKFNHEENTGERKLRDELLKINKDAAVYYNRVLRSPDGALGYRYLSEKRKLSDETIMHFGLGFSEKKPDALYLHLKDKGYTDDLINKSGLVTFSERGVRDKFWNRVIFPIMDVNSRVIGFGGRVMGDGMPKYLNSPETAVFDKSNTLYALNFARKSRRKNLLICEGYMDVIALHQAGFTNAVASLGTAFGEKHARLLKRYTDSVILTQDSDEAGIRAKLRAFPILYDAGLKVKALDTGQYKDPDEFIKAEGAEGYEACIRKSKNAFLFTIEAAKRDYDLSDPAEKTAFYNSVADRLCLFKDRMERDNYVDSVSREFMIDRDELSQLTEKKFAMSGQEPALRAMNYMPASRQAVSGLRRSADTITAEASGNKASVAAEPSSGNASPQKENTDLGFRGDIQPETLKEEQLIISWLCERPETVKAVSEYMKPEDFRVAVYGKLASEIYKNEGDFSPAGFLDNPELSDSDRELAALAFAEAERLEDIGQKPVYEIEKGLTEAIRAIKLNGIECEIAACGNDARRFGELLREKKSVAGIKISLS